MQPERDAETTPYPHVFDPFVHQLIADAQAKQAASETEANAEAKPIVPYWSDARRDLSVYQDDALELLAKLKPETFDLIFADPPYFLSSNGMTCQGGKRINTIPPCTKSR